MKILSLFDGMACGMIAMLGSGIEVDRYVAYEIDKYATQTSSYNFPMIEHKGDVFNADFTEYLNFDFLVGGSPCTYWSIAQTKNRETVASGMGWELFSQYVRALHDAMPKYFIYENNKSMSKEIKASITETFGFEPICINSALVSAQNRQRLYWVGIRQADGTYKKANVEQPADRGILLKDVLDNANPFNATTDGKAHTLTATYYKIGGVPISEFGNEKALTRVAEPIPKCVAQRGRNPENPKSREVGLPTEQMFEAMEDEKTNTLTTVQKDNLVAQPINTTENGKVQTIKAQYQNTSTVNICCYKSTYGASAGMGGGHLPMVTEPIGTVRVGAMPRPNGELSKGQAFRIYSENAKSTTLRANGGGAGGKTGLYAISSEEKKPNVYEVKDGMITVKGKQYPIKLQDGMYIIRKLTVSECMRLQTVPEWYQFPVSNSQAYKMLGNGWTVEVIKHLILSALTDRPLETETEYNTLFDYETKHYV